MIDPKAVTNFHRTLPELEEWALFCLFVSNKPAYITATKLDAFLRQHPGTGSPMEKVRVMRAAGTLRAALEATRLGQYARLEAALVRLVDLDLRACTLADLLAVPGIGPKTARFFLLHSRPDAHVAVLDTHILKWLRDLEYDNVPSITPQSPVIYAKWERVVLRLAHEVQMHPALLDLAIWARYKGASTT